MSELCVGLFGTCGITSWRQDLFIPAYEKANIKYYNPQVDDWKPEDATIEAEHLANDNIILFPVTNETYGLGSLGEVGFSILNAIKLDDRRNFVVMIEDKLREDYDWDPNLYQESIRMRALVKQHIKKLNYSNVYVTKNLTTMLNLSILLYENEARIRNFKL